MTSRKNLTAPFGFADHQWRSAPGGLRFNPMVAYVHAASVAGIPANVKNPGFQGQQFFSQFIEHRQLFFVDNTADLFFYRPIWAATFENCPRKNQSSKVKNPAIWPAEGRFRVILPG